MAADQVAREYSGVSVREFIKYINTLVAKKVLPQELKAEYEGEDNMFTFREFVDEIQEDTKQQAPIGDPPPGVTKSQWANPAVRKIIRDKGVMPKRPNDKVVAKTTPPPKVKTPKVEIKPSASPAKPGKVKATAANTRNYDKTLAIQKRLIAQGAKIKADGLMGPNTRAAMKKFGSKPVSPKRTTVPKSTAQVPSMPKVPVKKVEVKPLAPPAKQPVKHDVSTKTGRRSWYNARVERARKAGHPNPTMYASQAALETGWGKSKSAKGNLVGMKARKDQAGETKGHTEYVKGKKVKGTSRFAQFGSEAGGIAQHGKEWKGGLTKSGGRKYATDPDYEKKIAAITKGYGTKSITDSFDVNEDKVVSRKTSDTGVGTTKFASGKRKVSDASGSKTYSPPTASSPKGQEISRSTPRIGGLKIISKPHSAAGPGPRGVKKIKDYRGKLGGTDVHITRSDDEKGTHRTATARSKGGITTRAKYGPKGWETSVKLPAKGDAGVGAKWKATGKDKKLKSFSGGKYGPSTNPQKEEMTFKDLVNQIQERPLTDTEVNRKEEIVKSMKKKMPEFKKNYGKDAKSVMYATATKIAKKKPKKT